MSDAPGGIVNVETRRLAAIMFTDIVGFSRQMGAAFKDPAMLERELDAWHKVGLK